MAFTITMRLMRFGLIRHPLEIKLAAPQHAEVPLCP